MKVSEIFYSIQGESTYAGLPFIFVRLAGCNLRCDYCDTPYARDEGREMTVEEVLKGIEQIPCTRLEITGGEPLLQEEVYSLIERSLNRGYTILIETNGSIRLDRVDKRVIKIVDVKTPGSGSGGSFLIDNIEYIDENDEVKFVIGDREDYEWSRDFVKEHLLDKGPAILFSPVFERLRPEELAGWILDDALDVRIQVQLHKLIWGADKRGV